MPAVLPADLPVLEAARRRRLSVGGWNWFCDARRMNGRSVLRLIESGMLRVDLTRDGAQALASPSAPLPRTRDGRSLARSPAHAVSLPLSPTTRKRLEQRAEALGTDLRGLIEAVLCGRATLPKQGRQPPPPTHLKLSPKYRFALEQAAADRGTNAQDLARTLLGKLLRDPDLMREVIGR